MIGERKVTNIEELLMKGLTYRILYFTEKDPVVVFSSNESAVLALGQAASARMINFLGLPSYHPSA